jgi:hypothetical protein
VRAAPSRQDSTGGESERGAFIGGGERERAGPAAGMGDSGGSVVSVDVERISFGGKVSLSPLFLGTRGVRSPRRDLGAWIGFRPATDWDASERFLWGKFVPFLRRRCCSAVFFFFCCSSRSGFRFHSDYCRVHPAPPQEQGVFYSNWRLQSEVRLGASLLRDSPPDK